MSQLLVQELGLRDLFDTRHEIEALGERRVLMHVCPNYVVEQHSEVLQIIYTGRLCFPNVLPSESKKTKW